jgi:diacylglycerol kinase family enzyme
VSTVLLVGNPTAQSGRNAARIERARDLLDERGLRHQFVSTVPDGGTVELVRERVEDRPIDLVIYMGGDGTFAEVARGILRSHRAAEVRLGMLPTGTANDQGRSFGLDSAERALPRNVEVIVAARETRLDAGRLRVLGHDGQVTDEHLFFDSAGWGISPRVLSLRNEDRAAIAAIPLVRDLYRDQLVYAGALLRTFLRSYVDNDKFDVDAVVDGTARRLEGLSDLVIKGTRVYGGLWVLDPEARHDDGLFEVVPFAGKRDWIGKAILHLDGNPLTADDLSAIGVTHSPLFRAREIELCFRPRGPLPLAAQIDGEELPAAVRVQVSVLPQALRLVVPAEHATA